MPPRLRLSREESAQLPQLLALVPQRRAEFPSAAGGPAQAAWIAAAYARDADDLTTNLIALLLFEHGVHRSREQVARDLEARSGNCE